MSPKIPEGPGRWGSGAWLTLEPLSWPGRSAWDFPSGLSRLLCRAMNSSEVEALGIRMLPGYKDPYHGRPLTKGELGCFLSHYRVWQEVRGCWGGLERMRSGVGGPDPDRKEGVEILILMGRWQMRP